MDTWYVFCRVVTGGGEFSDVGRHCMSVIVFLRQLAIKSIRHIRNIFSMRIFLKLKIKEYIY